jgi:circadian clock protein KaiC
MATERIPTGIPGFDKLVLGGFVSNSLNLVTGGTGTGKTVFALQFAYNQAKAGRPVLYISFDEDNCRILADAASFGWDLDGLQKQGKLVVMNIEPISNPDLYAKISSTIAQNGISIVVVDSVSEMALAFQENVYKLRRELYVLSDLLHKHDCTTLLTAEVGGEASLDALGAGAVTRDGVTEFVADSVITLHNAGIGGEGDRAVRVLKMRRTQHIREPMPMRITGKGISIG